MMSLPIYSLPEPPSTTRLHAELRSRVEVERLRRGWSRSRFIAWCVEQFLDLVFLSAENRAYIRRRGAELGHFDPLETLNWIVTRYRRARRQYKPTAIASNDAD